MTDIYKELRSSFMSHLDVQINFLEDTLDCFEQSTHLWREQKSPGGSRILYYGIDPVLIYYGVDDCFYASFDFHSSGMTPHILTEYLIAGDSEIILWGHRVVYVKVPKLLDIVNELGFFNRLLDKAGLMLDEAESS